MKEAPTCGIDSVDRLKALDPCTLEDYLRGVSEYVKAEATLAAGAKKAAQIRLSYGLAKALLRDLRMRLPVQSAIAGERNVAGALRTAQADVSEFHEMDGLRFAVEIKPVNLAVGRAIWNRFGDIRFFAVNVHLKFPFAVVGGILVVPTWEVTKKGVRKPTLHLIDRAVKRIIRARGRSTEADAAHLLEGVAVLAYDPDTAVLNPDLPPVQSGLRWTEFVNALAASYESRFDVEPEAKPSGQKDKGTGPPPP